MCNLYAVRHSAAEIAAHFGVAVPNIDVAAETRPREPGLIVRGSGDRAILQSLSWGFPLPQFHKVTKQPINPKPVNLVAALTSPMWERIVTEPRYRCLIPLSEFAEPDGRPGAMTRTWFSVKGAPIVAWAGFCRNTEGWGPVFAGMTTDSNAAVAPLNPRMPVLLDPADYERWLHGSVQDVIAFQFRPFPAERLTRRATEDLWVARHRATPHAEQQAFL